MRRQGRRRAQSINRCSHPYRVRISMSLLHNELRGIPDPALTFALILCSRGHGSSSTPRSNIAKLPNLLKQTFMMHRTL